MKDLTSATAFNTQIKQFHRVIKERMVDINDYDEFLVELREKKREVEQGNEADFMMSGYQDRYNQESFEQNQIQNDNFDDSIEKLKNDFETRTTDDTINSQMSINADDGMMQSPLLKRITLNLKDNLEEYFEEQENYYQDKKEERLAHKTRLLAKWNSALYSARIFGATVIGSVVNILVSIPRFKIFPIELLVGSLGMYLLENKKLSKFNDGIFCGNFKLGNQRIMPLAKKNRKELYSSVNDDVNEKSNDEYSFNQQSSQDSLFGSSDDNFNFDDNDGEESISLTGDDNFGLDFGGLNEEKQLGLSTKDDDKGSSSENPLFNMINDKNNKGKNNLPAHSYVAKPVSQSNSEFLNELNLKAKNITPDNIAKSYISFEDGKYNVKKFHQQATEILENYYQNRKEIAKNMKSHRDIMRVFMPLVAKYNKDFGQFSNVPNESNVVKNIAFALFLTFKEISTNFRNVHKDDFDPNFYIFLGNCTETALYYKVEFKLPTFVSVDVFKRKLNVLSRYLRKTSNDTAVQLSIEEKEDGGALKLFKVFNVKDKGNLLPVISSGDILRFKGMKVGNQELLEELTSAGDYKCLIGMREGEYPVIQDFGASNNSAFSNIGGSGAGKTASMSGIFESSLWQYPPEEVGFLIFDPKSGQDWRVFKLFPHVLGYFGADDIPDYGTFLSILNKVVKLRGDYMNSKVRAGTSNYYEARKKFSKNADWDRLCTVPRLIVILDEQLNLIQALDSLDAENKLKNSNRDKDSDEPKLSVDNKKMYYAQINRLSAVTREEGITLVLMSQKADNESIPKKTFSTNSSMKMWMRGSTNELLRLDKNSPYTLEGLPTGTGYFFAEGSYSKGVKVNTPLASGSPDAGMEYTKLFALVWNILQSSRGIDMFEPSDAFCLNDFKQENTKKKIINRPEQVVEVAKMLYTGDVFVEKIKGEKTPKIDIVDDILNSISAESKKKFKKEYCDLVAIKYPDKAQALRQQMNVHSLENSSTQSPSKQIENTQKVENKVQQQIRKQLENNSPKAKEIKDDNASVGAGDTLADDEFISDNDEEQFSVFGDDNDEFIENTFNKEETSESKDGLTQEENKEPTEDDLKDLFGNQKQEVAKVEKHVGKEVPKDKQIIDDGTRDRPQTVHSVYKYCVAYHKETVKLKELRKHFSDNAINMSVSNGILTTSMTPDELIFVGNVK